MHSKTEEFVNNCRPAPAEHLPHHPLADLPLASLLLDCLRYDGQAPEQNRLEQLSKTEWQALVTLALQQAVGPLLDHRLTRAGLISMMPADVKESLRQQYRHNTLRNLKLQNQLRQIVIALRETDIPVIALKGIYLALAVYKNLGLREMRDIDLLIRRQDINKAMQVLQKIGYGQPYAEIPSTSYQHLPPLNKPDTGADVELHWTIVPSHSPFKIDPDELWERARPFNVADFELLALSSEDMVLHLCLHSAYIHRFAHGIRSLVDIAETILVSRNQLDWSTLEHQSSQWESTNVTNISLFLANQLLNFQFPEPITTTIKAVDIGPEILVYAVNQLMGEPQEKITIARNFSELWGDNSVLTKAKILLRSIFRPKKIIAQMYAVPETSVKVYFYYLVRARDLWLRYGRSARQMMAEESEFTSKIELDNALSDWLTTA